MKSSAQTNCTFVARRSCTVGEIIAADSSDRVLGLSAWSFPCGCTPATSSATGTFTAQDVPGPSRKATLPRAAQIIAQRSQHPAGIMCCHSALPKGTGYALPQPQGTEYAIGALWLTAMLPTPTLSPFEPSSAPRRRQSWVLGRCRQITLTTCHERDSIRLFNAPLRQAIVLNRRSVARPHPRRHFPPQSLRIGPSVTAMVPPRPSGPAATANTRAAILFEALRGRWQLRSRSHRDRR